MASFVIHYVAGEEFLSTLEKEYGIEITPQERNDFLLGNLIVDSSRIKKEIPEGLNTEELKEFKMKLREEAQNEKVSTHFRLPDDANLCIQVPKLEKFLSQYKDLVKKDFSALGYLFHLYTDKIFFNDLFLDTFECIDKDGNPSIYQDEVVAMRVNKNGEVHPSAEFWNHDSPVSIYHDYTVMNKILLEYYGTAFDKEKLEEAALNFKNPGITEVDYENITSVINLTAKFIKESYAEEDTKLNVFKESSVKNFIKSISTNFINENPEIIKSLPNNTRELIKKPGEK